MPLDDTSVLVQEFRLNNVAAEFEKHSQAEIERQQSTKNDFDENLYQEAVALVLKKLSNH
mgnify:CR=1 FL=1